MATINLSSSNLGNALEEMLVAPDIIPGDQPSYQLCKTIWVYHVLGIKLVESPIKMAQSQPREISIQDGPEDRLRDLFVAQWAADKADEVIYNTAATARAYGIATVALLCEEIAADQPIPPEKLADLLISFSTFDPLNTAGSLVLNQDPNSIDFQKVTAVAVSGKPYHRSRTVTIMNERPIYIEYTSSGFGFVGRSVFQRALFPLKSFIQTLITDDLVVKKAGVFIAKLKAAGAIIDNIMQSIAGLKRFFVKAAMNGNVISIGTEEEIETLNMQNIDGAYGMARKNILDNIAVSNDMPAIILNSETYAEGFGEGTEDAKNVARYIDGFRRWLEPLYVFMDRIVMRRAWNQQAYKVLQQDFPEYKSMPYDDAFFRWSTSFKAQWPSLLIEPDSERVKTDDVKLKAIIATVEVFGPMLDPENKATLIQWAQENLNENKMMFQSALDLDIDALMTYEPPEPMEEPNEPKPFAAQDAVEGTARPREIAARLMRRLSNDELTDLVEIMGRAPEGLPRPDEAGARNQLVAQPATNPPKRDRAAYFRDWRAAKKRQRQEGRLDA
jgi:hypothetical protein